MLKNPIQIGDKIELEHVKSLTGHILSTKRYGSQMVDFDGIRIAKIAMPIYENKVVPLEVGDEYTLCFFTGAGLYQCRGKVKKRYLEKNMYVLDVEFLTQLKKYQRRKYYRLDCLFTMKQRKIDDIEKVLLKRLEKDDFASEVERQHCLEEFEKLPREWTEGSVSDVSGGGIRFHSNVEWHPQDELEVYLPLSMSTGIMPVKLMVRVIACIHFEGSRIAYETRGEFIGVADADRETISKYVFEEQRRRLRKD